MKVSRTFRIRQLFLLIDTSEECKKLYAGLFFPPNNFLQGNLGDNISAS